MAFDPNQTQAAEVRSIANALIVPFGSGRSKGISRPAGVFDAEGRFQPQSQCLRHSTLAVTTQPADAPPATDSQLAGTWLYGGMLYQHFGHFLAESTARLWAADHAGMPVDGVIFLPKKQMNRPKRFVEPMLPLLRLFDPRFGRAVAPVAPVQVERLVLAPQGFGTGDMMAGSPEYRAFIRAGFGRDIPGSGAENIYISRTRLFSKRGRYFSEARLEALLEAEGYRIFHPQEHPLEEQIAQYKAARRIVSSDSSALHLAAFFTQSQDRIAIILRRPGNTIGDYLRQFQSFAGIRPDVCDALGGGLWQFEGAKLSQMSEIYAELDFPALAAQLAAQGYIRNPGAWTMPPATEIEAERRDLSQRLGRDIIPMPETD